jgi:acetyl-CoA carboxylase, biotin carboxylase subunit
MPMSDVVVTAGEGRGTAPDWLSCPCCRALHYAKRLARNFKICPECGYHFRLSARERIAQLVDPGSFAACDAGTHRSEPDPLTFTDQVPYRQRLAEAGRRSGEPEAAVFGTAMIARFSVVLAVLDFAFMGGSMGTAVGQIVTSATELSHSTALRTGADAVHPGYGFLSEDPDAAEPVTTLDEGLAAADRIGYPVIIKAAAGGGGRGMTVVHHRADFAGSYLRTRSTAQAVFGDSAVYLERFLTNARHVEIQFLCDAYGTAVHLGERDCSVQRRHQKLIEKAPSTRLTPELRAAMGRAAVGAALSVGYTGAGTMEFLLDADGHFSFMEVNARIQLEHPVTEMTTGIDLVQEQLRIASGAPLSITQDAVRISGAAIECRVSAKDPERGFAPSPGAVSHYRAPGGPWTRVDSDCCAGYVVSAYHDSLLAKVIVWAPDRPQALARMDRALAEFDIRGPRTTVDFHRAILRHPTFRAGRHSIAFVDQLTPGSARPEPAVPHSAA